MGTRTLSIKGNILEANAEKADIIRALLDSHRVLMINIMSSSGSGKTSLIMQAVNRLRDKIQNRCNRRFHRRFHRCRQNHAREHPHNSDQHCGRMPP